MRKQNILIAATFVLVLGALGVTQVVLQQVVEAQGGETVMAPRFEVDPFWPKPLPILLKETVIAITISFNKTHNAETPSENRVFLMRVFVLIRV